MKHLSYEFLNDIYKPAVVGKNGFKTPIWMQQRWEEGKYAVYVRQNGCGHCCSAMVCNLLGIKINPHEHIERCVELWGEPSIAPNGNQQYYFLTPNGIVESLNGLGIKAECFGHKSQGVDNAVKHIVESLKQDKMVIFISSPSKDFLDNPFSKGDHYVLAVGLTDNGKILIANSSTKSDYVIGEGIQEVDEEVIKKSLDPIAEPIKKTWGELVNLHEGIGYIVVG